MNENIERIERYLKDVDLPERVSDQHRQQLRRQVLNEIERTKTMSVRRRLWKIAAVVALICTGVVAAAVVGVKIRQYHFVGRDPDGTYHFSTEPETIYERTYQGANGTKQGVIVTTSTAVSLDSDDANGASVEQMQSDLEEIDLLRQQDARELVRVIDTQVNGHFWRTCVFKYVLSDGRTHTINEADPDEDKPRTPVQMEQDFEEVTRLREQGLRDVVSVIETDLEGEIHRTLICRYVLAGGREVTMGEGDPELAPPTKMLSPEQIQEVAHLQLLKQGEFLGSVERQMYGKTFTFERYLFTLSDGTVVTRAEGKPKGQKTTLTEADWKELHSLKKAGAGEYLGIYEEEIRGKVFVFERKRYILSDGTEVIRAEGDPKEE